MRNDWYPKRIAEYMTDTALRGLNLQDSIFERDYNFRPRQEASKSEKQEEVKELSLKTGPVIELHLLNVRFFSSLRKILMCLTTPVDSNHFRDSSFDARIPQIT